MSTADYNQGVRDAQARLAELAPPAGEPTLESLRTIYLGERSVLAQAELRIRDLLKPEATTQTKEGAMRDDMVRYTALESVLSERARQDAKWGEQNNDPFCYITVLVEEVGELAQAALHTRFGGPAAAHLREEAVHTAAVALAIVECLDRGKWRWPE